MIGVVPQGESVDAAPLLVLQQVSKRFAADQPPAVDGLSFAVAEREILALLGPSGCGKTTTLRIIAGLRRPMAARSPSAAR